MMHHPDILNPDSITKPCNCARLKSERDAAWAALVEIVRLGKDAKGRRKSVLGGVSCQMLEVAESALRVVPPNAKVSASGGENQKP